MQDSEVIEWVRTGRRDAVIAALLPEYRRKVFSLAYSILRDAAPAEDVAQEVFVKLWRALPGYDGRAKLSTWLYAIARNTSLSALRSRRESVSLSVPETLREAEQQLAAMVDAPQNDEALDPRLLERALGGLPEKQRQVVTLFYLQERSYEDVAQLLGMPLGTVKNLLHRARTRLEAQLRPAEGVPA